MNFPINLIIDRFTNKCNISFFSKIVRQLMTLEVEPMLGSTNVNWIHKQQYKLILAFYHQLNLVLNGALSLFNLMERSFT